MKFMKATLLTLASLAAFTARAGELTPEVEAKFLKAIIASSGTNRISCSDAALKAALEAQGIVVDGSAQIAWTTNPSEARAFKTFGRLVITNKRELSASAAVLIQEDAGRPRILLNTANLHASKVQLSDAVLKIAEKI